MIVAKNNTLVHDPTMTTLLVPPRIASPWLTALHLPLSHVLACY